MMIPLILSSALVMLVLLEVSVQGFRLQKINPSNVDGFAIKAVSNIYF